jgi:hypothetical protein
MFLKNCTKLKNGRSKVVCFVLFCHAEISQTTTSWHTLGTFGKFSMSRGALNLVWDCLELWCESYWLLLHFLNENEIKSKLKTLLEFGVFLVLLESPWWFRFNKVYFTIFRAKVWKIFMFWVNFAAENPNKLQKNWVWKEKSVEPPMCSLLGQWYECLNPTKCHPFTWWSLPKWKNPQRYNTHISTSILFLVFFFFIISFD